MNLLQVFPVLLLILVEVRSLVVTLKPVPKPPYCHMIQTEKEVRSIQPSLKSLLAILLTSDSRIFFELRHCTPSKTESQVATLKIWFFERPV